MISDITWHDWIVVALVGLGLFILSDHPDRRGLQFSLTLVVPLSLLLIRLVVGKPLLVLAEATGRAVPFTSYWIPLALAAFYYGLSSADKPGVRYPLQLFSWALLVIVMVNLTLLIKRFV